MSKLSSLLLGVIFVIGLLQKCGKGFVYKHWPDTREFITQTVELRNRWIRLSCYYNRV